MLFNLFQDYFAYHITEKKNIDSIIKYGLIPSMGERSLLAKDEFKAIFFFDEFYNINNWMEFLYKNKDKDTLEVLRFNLKNLRWFIHNRGDEFYIKHKIPIDKIDYLEIYNHNMDILSFNNLYMEDVYNLDYRWNKLKEYHKNKYIN